MDRVRFMANVTRGLVMVRHSPRRGILLLITAYQRRISGRLGLTCMYEPSCSEYAALVIQHRGVIRGTWAAGKRLARCRPEYRGTLDYPEEARYEISN